MFLLPITVSPLKLLVGEGFFRLQLPKPEQQMASFQSKDWERLGKFSAEKSEKCDTKRGFGAFCGFKHQVMWTFHSRKKIIS